MRSGRKEIYSLYHGVTGRVTAKRPTHKQQGLRGIALIPRICYASTNSRESWGKRPHTPISLSLGDQSVSATGQLLENANTAHSTLQQICSRDFHTTCNAVGTDTASTLHLIGINHLFHFRLKKHTQHCTAKPSIQCLFRLIASVH